MIRGVGTRKGTLPRNTNYSAKLIKSRETVIESFNRKQKWSLQLRTGDNELKKDGVCGCFSGCVAAASHRCGP
uniref:Uncharacterized protein n=1 Tax=Knipowitschia caucasica TaxID=637954 RepID=A0AAV2JHN5_KNICA